MCNIFKTCWVTKKKKRVFTDKETIIKFKRKLKSINTKLSKYSSIAKEKRKYGKFLIVII